MSSLTKLLAEDQKEMLKLKAPADNTFSNTTATPNKIKSDYVKSTPITSRQEVSSNMYVIMETFFSA